MSQNESFLPFALPDIGESEILAVEECLRSGWLTTGPRAKEFENKFASFLGDESLECISVNSASMGIRVILDAHGISEGDEVIVPVYTFGSTAMMPFHAGANLKFVDINYDTFNIDINEI